MTRNNVADIGLDTEMPKADKIVKIADDVTLQAPVDATRFVLEYAKAIIVGNHPHHPLNSLVQFESIASKS